MKQMERMSNLKKNKKEVKEKTVENTGCSPEGCESCGGCGSIDPETMVQILGARNQELEDKYMRLQAEYLNFKTRKTRSGSKSQ